jgi:hypothetical protein
VPTRKPADSASQAGLSSAVNPIASNREREEFWRQMISQRTGTAAVLAGAFLDGDRAARFLPVARFAGAVADVGCAGATRSCGVWAAGPAAGGAADRSNLSVRGPQRPELAGLGPCRWRWTRGRQAGASVGRLPPLVAWPLSSKAAAPLRRRTLGVSSAAAASRNDPMPSARMIVDARSEPSSPRVGGGAGRAAAGGVDSGKFEAPDAGPGVGLTMGASGNPFQ